MRDIRRAIRAQADADRARVSRSFFKTGAGEYGAGDRFLGLTTPAQRRIARAYRDLRDESIRKLLASRWHEERFIALVILTERFARGDASERERIVRWYLAVIPASVNNWDLVDATAYKILGEYVSQHEEKRARLLRRAAPRNDRSMKGVRILDQLARSRNLWKRRVAIIATLAFIARGEFSSTFRIARALLRDDHDLIHKAVGWMLREVGKRDRRALGEFLREYAARMPRTMLRYAIERFPEPQRRAYLRNK